jgi:hypothetical protein
MSLYEMIYGLDINIEQQNIIKWYPCKDGIVIDLNKNINNYNLIIKLFLDYNDTLENKEILKKYFS